MKAAQPIVKQPVSAMPAATRTSGSFVEARVRSSDWWVRSSDSWVFVGSIVGSFVEKRLKCAAIRYIRIRYGAYSGAFLRSMFAW
jgi:hypothetical protein